MDGSFLIFIINSEFSILCKFTIPVVLRFSYKVGANCVRQLFTVISLFRLATKGKPLHNPPSRLRRATSFQKEAMSYFYANENCLANGSFSKELSPQVTEDCKVYPHIKITSDI